MDFKNLTNKEIISCHLDLLHDYDKNTTVFSSLTAALRDARQNTGRDIDTGQSSNSAEEHKLANWSGAICYLIILDQVGKCYKPRTDPRYSDLNSIQRSLKYYTNLSDPEIGVIYALRNAFAHDYSISNINEKNPLLQHHFTLLGHRDSEFIKLPKNNWKGYQDKKTLDNMTYISLPSLGYLIEEVYKEILRINRTEGLEVILKGGTKEIQTRYLQFIYTVK